MYKVGEKGLVGGSRFHKFADGATIILMTTEDCGLAFEHWLDDPEGNRKRIVCPGGNAKGRYGQTPDDCKICARYEATGDEVFKPKRRFFIKFVICDAKKVKIKGRRGKYTVNYVPQKDVKLAAVGPKIFNGIQGLAEDADEYGDITEIPIKVKRSGAGLNTGYTVLPLSADKLINIPKEYVDDNPSFEDVEKESTEAEVDAVLGESDVDDADEDMDYLDEEDSEEDSDDDSEEDDDSDDDSEGDFDDDDSEGDSDDDDSEGDSDDDDSEGDSDDDEDGEGDDDSEEDDDYEIDDDEEEEEEPVKKKKKKKVMPPPVPSNKKKKGNKGDTKKKKDKGDLEKKKPSLGRLKRSNRR